MTPVRVTSTVAAAAGAEANVSVIAFPAQAAWVTATAELLISAVKSNGLTVLHATASVKLAVTDVLPDVAEIEAKMGGVVSTVTVRVIVDDARPLLSIARKTKVCGPSPSGAAGVNVQPMVAEVPHAGQVIPAVEKSPVPTFASIRETTAPNACAAPE